MRRPSVRATRMPGPLPGVVWAAALVIEVFLLGLLVYVTWLVIKDH